MKMWILAAIIITTMLPLTANAQSAVDVQAEIQQIKQQLAGMEDLKSRLADLEKKLDESQKAQEELKKAQDASKPTVTAATKDSKIKIDGRIFTGIFSTGKQGSSPNWSTDINDAKLRFTFNPSKNITIVNRLSTSGAKAADFDYFYLDYAGALSPTSIIRVGQRKIDVGQETFVDNPIENMLITNSISHVSGYGTGVALLGKINNKGNSPLYEVGFVNGPKGVMTRPSTGLPVNAKIGAPITNNLFASASYFKSGKLRGTDNSAISVAELSSAPSGAVQWDRKLWEVDLRYNYGPSGIRSLIPAGKLPPVMVGATYGSFSDSATGASDRDGKYWFVEGLARLSDKLYSAVRYSVTDLDDGVLGKLGKSPEAVNSYKRTSIGLGYALTDLTQLKTEYTINNTNGGASDPSLNQWAIGVASKF